MACDVGSAGSATWLPSRRWLLVAPALLFLWIIAQIDKTNVSLVIADPTFLRELNVAGHNTELGGLMSSFFVGYGVSIFIWGFLVDRFGPRKCVIAGILGWAVTLFLSSRAGGIKEYLLIRFFLGAAEGNLWPVCNALTNRWFPVREHSRVQAFWITGIHARNRRRRPRRYRAHAGEWMAGDSGCFVLDLSLTHRSVLFREGLAARAEGYWRERIA